MSNGAPHITWIESYFPADENTPEAYLAGRATCEAPRCDGRRGCENCQRGAVRVELFGAPAQAAYEAWAAADNDDYSIASGYHLGSLTKSAKGWAAFLPMAVEFMAEHRVCSMSNDSTNDGEPGSGMLSWQTEMVEWMASEIRDAAKTVAA